MGDAGHVILSSILFYGRLFERLNVFVFINMIHTGIQDISKRSDLPKVLMKVEEKFRLDLTGETSI